MINPCFYYHLIKPGNKQQLLTARHKITGKGFNIYLVQQQQDLGQEMWMLKSADLQSVYYIYNCYTGLVLELEKDNKIDLHHCKQREGQKFRFNQVLGENDQYTISQYSKALTILTKKGDISCQNASGQQEAYWILRRVIKNKVLFNSVVVQCQNSGYVMQVFQNAQKQGFLLQQNSWQGLFSQRWHLQKHKEFYLIRNIKSNLVASVRHKKVKEGAQIVQEKQHQNNHKHQLWVYSIRLASEKDLFLCCKNYTKQNSALVLYSQQYSNLWRILSSQPL